MDTSARRKIARLVPRLLAWYASQARDLPWRRTRDPYAIWVSEIMLQQTQVGTVLPYYERWMETLPAVDSLAHASSQRLHRLWEGLGYYTRVRNMQKAARVICKKHDGRFPARFEEVLALPGIGRYTAGAICSIAFNQPTPVLDGNVIRVLTRLFGIATDPKETKTREHLWQLAETLVAAAAEKGRKSEIVIRKGTIPLCSALNQSLMELGATLCVPRNPVCSECPARRDCVARLQKLTDRIPYRRVRPRTVARKQTIVVARHQDRFWAVQRPPGSINGGLWEFPQLEEIEDVSAASPPSARRRGQSPADSELLGVLKHSITRYRITARVLLRQAGLKKLKSKEAGQWLSVTALQRTPFSAMHRRIADLLVRRERSSNCAAGRRRNRVRHSQGRRSQPGRRR